MTRIKFTEYTLVNGDEIETTDNSAAFQDWLLDLVEGNETLSMVMKYEGTHLTVTLE